MVADRLPENLGRVPCGIHAIPGRYLFELGVTTTASAMRWFRELIGLAQEDMAALEREAAASPPGARNLIMQPFLMGARSTRWNPDARGLLLGLSLGHTRGDIARALMEGVGYEVGTCLDGLRDMGIAPDELAVIGGGAKSDLWAQIKADILGMPVYRPLYTEAASLGAAVLAATAVGLVTDPAAAARAWNPSVHTFLPNLEAARMYKDRRALFDDMRAVLKLYIAEEGSPLARAAEGDARLVATSAVAYVEARAAFARRRREHALSSAAHRRLVHTLDTE
jgi:xylulokinase